MNLEPSKRRLAEPVPWYIFIWAASIVIALFGGMVLQHDALAKRIDAVDQDRQEIQVQLSAIQAQLQSLDLRLTELRNDIRNQ